MPVKIMRKDGVTKKPETSAHAVHGGRSVARPTKQSNESELQPYLRATGTLKGFGGLTPRASAGERQSQTQAAPGYRSATPEAPTQPSAPTAPVGAPQSVPHDIAAQRSFTLYKKDCQLIRDVQVHFLQNGNHVTESQVVRIALRALEISEKLQELHMQIKGDDGRKHRQSSPKAA
jgi:hypothetical protein